MANFRAKGRTRGVRDGYTRAEAITDMLKRDKGNFVIEPESADRVEFAPDYVPTPTARRIHACDANLIAAIGPFGCGKSFMSWRHTFGLVANLPSQAGVVKARTLAMRNTVAQTIDTMLPSFFEALPLNWKAEWSASERVMFVTYSMRREGSVLRVEHEIAFRSAERAEDERKLKSYNATTFLASEFSELNFELMMTGFTRTGRFPTGLKGGLEMKGLIESNNFARSHKMYRFFIEREGVDRLAEENGIPPGKFMQVFRYPGGRSEDAENVGNLPKNYYKNLILAKGEHWARINVDNEPGVIADGRRCFQFSEDHHVKAGLSPDPHLPVHLGVDLGRDSAYVLFQERSDGCLRAVDLYFVDNVPLVTAAPDAADYFSNRYPTSEWTWTGVWVDPGGLAESQNDDVKPIHIVEAAFRRFRCPVRVTSTNDVNTRIEVVNDAFGRINPVDFEPRLMISDDLRMRPLIDACNGYHWAEMKEWNRAGEVRYQEKPHKDHHSHLAEALQYGVLRGTGRRAVGGPLGERELWGRKRGAGSIELDVFR